jgi:hypothetical protein
MQSMGETPAATDVNFDAATCDEIAKRIRKLRWIGRDDEADLLAQSVARMPHFFPIVAAPRDTD